MPVLLPAVGFHVLRVAAVDRLTADAVAITFEVPPALARTFAFRAGQHLTLRRVLGGADLRRTYSLCTSAAGGPLRVAVKRLDGGVLSSWLCSQLQVGNELEVLPPAGRFGPSVDPARSHRYGLVAAGSGITPLLSIAATVLEVEPASDVVLLYANRTSRDVMLLEELSDLKDRFPERLQVLHLLSREEQESALLTGRIDRERLARLFTTLLPPADVDEWFLCGPLAVVEVTRQALLDSGIPPDRISTELFYAGVPPPRAPRDPALGTRSSRVTARLHGRTTQLAVPQHGEPILDALLAVRPDAPFACRGGVCGTCRARVLSGSVEMDVNYALAPEELAAGVVLTCQSRPITDEVRLEYL